MKWKIAFSPLEGVINISVQTGDAVDKESIIN
jgi:hypothetical protein